MRTEKEVRNRVDLKDCLIEKDKRNGEERSFDCIKKYKNTPWDKKDII